MAGIGFELKKIYSEKEIFLRIRAYGYADAVSAAPSILVVSLLLGVFYLSHLLGVDNDSQNLLVGMISYSAIAALFISNLFSMITTRYVADMIHLEQPEKVMPSFYGALSIMLTMGAFCYGCFLLCSGVKNWYMLLCMCLFFEFLTVWTELNYLTAIGDYKNVLKIMLVSLGIAFFSGYCFWVFRIESVSLLLLGAIVGFGVMAIWYHKQLLHYFKIGVGSNFVFLSWFDEFPQLMLVGIFILIGSVGHLIIMWTSPIGMKVEGLFYGVQGYDVATLVAFLSIAITTIGFLTSVERKFYPYYKMYFLYYNDGGSIGEIHQAEEEMVKVLKKEIGYMVMKQFFTTVTFVIVGSIILSGKQIGFTENMVGTYRILCVGYAFYAIANCTMLISLYFSDYKGVLIGATLFAFISIFGTQVLKSGNQVYYGLGILVAGLLFYLYATIRLFTYMNHLSYHILCKQPSVLQRRDGFFTKKFGEHENEKSTIL